MPYIVDGNCVKKKTTGETMKCYSGEGAHEKAVKYSQALNMNTSAEKADMTLRNKDDKDVNYVDNAGQSVGMGVQMCKDCRFFVEGACTVVMGDIAPEGHCDLWMPEMVTGGISTVAMSMAITKASFDPVSKEMRYTAVASDTDPDSLGERMSLQLYRSFIKRILENEPVPEVLRSSYWQGGHPYLSVSHYPDLDGYGIAGVSRQEYIDGNRFKVKGVFVNELNPKVAERAYEAVKADIKNEVPLDERIRISIAFIDWQHTHGDFVFKRADLTDECPMCMKGITVSEYQDGHLIHNALTRVPVNKRANIGLEELSMATMQSDAAGIVGEEEAAELEKRAKEKGLVGRSAVANPAVVVKSEVVKSFGGALTVSDAIAYEKAQEEVDHLWDLWYMLSEVMWNINIASEEALPDKSAAIKSAVDDFQKNVTAKALVTLAQLDQIISGGIEMANEVTTTPAATQVVAPAPAPQAPVQEPKHVLDDTFAKVKAQYDAALANPALTRQQRLQQLQVPINELGAVMLRGVDVASPLTAADIQKTVEETVTRAIAAAFGQQGPGILTGQLQAAATPAGNGDPTPRQLMPAPQMGQAPVAQRSKLRDIVRRSVMGPGAPQPQGQVAQ